jgi:hypothetical protein
MLFGCVFSHIIYIMPENVNPESVFRAAGAQFRN